MSAREDILSRIREALGNQPSRKRGVLPSPADHRRVLPKVSGQTQNQIELFARNSADLRTRFVSLSSEAGLASELCQLRDQQKWQRVATHKGFLAQAQATVLGLPLLVTDDGFSAHELEKCDVAITECDALVAQTGTVVVTSRSAGGRALSCLPPHHVVIARASQLVPDLPAAFDLIKERYGTNYPGMISFITGPSRTGDIERTLVLGAHGPKALTIFMI